MVENPEKPIALIPAPSFGVVFSFGWNALPLLLRAHLWIYGLIYLARVLLTGFTASSTHFRTASDEWIATFSALAAATRLILPANRITGKQVLSIVGIYLTALAAAAIVVVPLMLGAPLIPFLYLFVLLPFRRSFGHPLKFAWRSHSMSCSLRAALLSQISLAILGSA
ncbi:MAG: hypothetical protein DLM50_04970 [Candidatus Meridianibacter frigidus]|nr:MAG: hypothetical protein DLM50_04970 [Candidatus Eremiobacteraeota bacterium]